MVAADFGLGVDGVGNIVRQDDVDLADTAGGIHVARDIFDSYLADVVFDLECQSAGNADLVGQFEIRFPALTGRVKRLQFRNLGRMVSQSR